MAARTLPAPRLAPVRAVAQLLHRPSGLGHPADIARAIAGAQAQDLRAGRLAFRSRGGGLSAADVDRARTEERSLVRTWAMRNTMHLLATDDVHWMGPLFEPGMESFARRRLHHFGFDARSQQRALAGIGRALEADGPLSRSELEQRLRRKRIELEPATRIHIFALAVATRVACLGPDAGSTTLLAPTRDWLGERPALDREAALAELARRYLRAFGPATEADFAGWAGLALGAVRAALRSIAREIEEVRAGGVEMWSLRGARRRSRGPVVRLLPGWDTYLMGYRDRDFIAPPARWKRIMVGGGILRPAITVDGRAAGTWRSRRAGKRLRVTLEPFALLDSATRQAVEAEVVDVGRFEGLEPKLEVASSPV